MDKEIKRKAKQQYFRYFRVWFIIVGVLFVLTVGVGIKKSMEKEAVRTNHTAPVERVYDYADMLTDEEEEKLRAYIAKKEAQYQADFVILTFSLPVEGAEAREQYGYRSDYWEQNMIDIADDFWDENGYGFNKNFEGDGSILIDNRYEGQRGEWLSTSGKVEKALGNYEINNVLDFVDIYYDSDPYEAYKSYIDEVCSYLGGVRFGVGYYLGAILFSVIVAAVYAASHLGKNRAKDTTAVNAYVVGGQPVLCNKGDDFIRKNVVRRHIQSSSSSGGGRSGGGGHHVSRGGARHGGGGRRH